MYVCIYLYVKKWRCLHVIWSFIRLDLQEFWKDFQCGPHKINIHNYITRNRESSSDTESKAVCKLVFLLRHECAITLLCTYFLNQELLSTGRSGWGSICHLITYKGTCSAVSQETLCRPIHRNGKYNCFVLIFRKIFLFSFLLRIRWEEGYDSHSCALGYMWSSQNMVSLAIKTGIRGVTGLEGNNTSHKTPTGHFYTSVFVEMKQSSYCVN